MNKKGIGVGLVLLFIFLTLASPFWFQRVNAVSPPDQIAIEAIQAPSHDNYAFVLDNWKINNGLFGSLSVTGAGGSIDPDLRIIDFFLCSSADYISWKGGNENITKYLAVNKTNYYGYKWIAPYDDDWVLVYDNRFDTLSKNITIFVGKDLTPPDIRWEFAYPNNTVYYTDLPDIKVSSIDEVFNVTSIKLYIDGKLVASGVSQISYSWIDISNGQHIITVESIDQCANVGHEFITFSKQLNPMYYPIVISLSAIAVVFFLVILMGIRNRLNTKSRRRHKAWTEYYKQKEKEEEERKRRYENK